MKENDAFRSANDDCSTAKRMDRLLLCDSDEEEQEETPDRSCDMHFANLHSRLTLSLVMLSSRGNVINRWAQFQNLWMPYKKMSKWFCDRKNESYEMCENMMIDSGGTRVLHLPNETRVSRVLLLLQDLLC